MTNASDPNSEDELSLGRRALNAFRLEVVGFHPRLHLYTMLASLLPLHTPGTLRARLLRQVGFQIGAGTRVNGPLKITGPRCVAPHLVIGRDCTIEADCTLDLSGLLTIGDRVSVDASVMILTSTHELDSAKQRAGKVFALPVTIGEGAWLGARCVVLPGVVIGAGAVVEPGAVVNKDVESNTRVGGTPATKLGVVPSREG